MKRLHYLLACALAFACAARGNEVWLEDLDLTHIVQGWGTAQARKSVEGKPMKIGETSFDHGLGTHGPGQFAIDLHGTAVLFEAKVGIDAETGTRGSVVFQVFADDKKVFDSGLRTGGMPTLPVSINLTHVKSLRLVNTDGGDGFDFDHADWADARIIFDGSPGPATVPLFTSDGFVTRRPARLDPLVSEHIASVARREGEPWFKWAGNNVVGYHVLEIIPGKYGLETFKGSAPGQVEGHFNGEKPLQKNEVLVVEPKSGVPLQVRILRQPRMENGYHAAIEIEAPVLVPRLELTVFRMPLAALFKEFRTTNAPDYQRQAEAAELAGDLSRASALWETIALVTPERQLRLFALERYYDLLAYQVPQMNALEAGKIEEARRYYAGVGIRATPLAGRHVIWVLPTDVISKAPIQRALAEADAVYGYLRYLTGNDTDGTLGRRLVIRYMAESSYNGGLYGDHGVGLGGKGPSIPFEGRAGLYHEISHDFFGGPNLLNTFPGFGEGWATYGVVPAFDYLGWEDWRDSLKEKFLLAFRAYRDKGAQFDQLPGYDANAGFLLRITERLSPEGDWAPVRIWLHSARSLPEPTEPNLRLQQFASILHKVGGKVPVDDEFLRSLGMDVHRNP